MESRPTSLTYSGLVVTFVETKLFSRFVYDYLQEEEYARLQEHLARSPSAGQVIRGSGGIRKVRWAGSGRGKRGGVRVIYLARLARNVIWMLTIYAKNEMETIPTDVLRQIREEIENG